MQIKSRVMFCSPQNISGASQKNSVATFFHTTEIDDTDSLQASA